MMHAVQAMIPNIYTSHALTTINLRHSPCGLLLPQIEEPHVSVLARCGEVDGVARGGGAEGGGEHRRHGLMDGGAGVAYKGV
jgi:hypothetical protein